MVRFQSELSRKQVKKYGREAAAATATAGFNPSYPGSRSRRSASLRSPALNSEFQSELSRKQVKKSLCPYPGLHHCGVSIRVIPEAGQEARCRCQGLYPNPCFNPSYPGSRSRSSRSTTSRGERWCFNPSYPGSRSRRANFVPGEPTILRFQSELSRKQVKKLIRPMCPVPASLWFQSELSRKQVKKLPHPRSIPPPAAVSIRVIPEAGQEAARMRIRVG